MRARRFLSTCLAGLAAVVVAGPAHGAYMTVYASDFETGAGGEWSDTTVTSDTAFTQFLGRHGPEFVEMTVNTVVGADLRLTFDLYIIDNWKGDDGDHRFHVEINGLEIFNETLDSSGGAQSYMGVPETEGTNLGFRANFDDAIYRGVTLNFSPATAVTVVRFGASGIANNLNIASWGVDNVYFEQQAPVVPMPASASLAGLGFALLFCSRPARRTAQGLSQLAPA